MGNHKILVDQKEIDRRLDETYKSASTMDIDDLENLKMVVFSDQHRGQKDGADDFLRCKQAYHAALGWYLENDFTLILLGDVEDLWECRPSTVCDAYSDTLELEKNFAEADHYIRVYGNHDDEWQNRRSVSGYLGKYLTKKLVEKGIPGGFLIRLKNGIGSIEGEVFFAHGHQGTLDSEQFSRFSKFLVRNVWRPIQRLTRIPSTSPAKEFHLRKAHEIAMHNWAAKKKGFVFITGHTHHPVFDSMTHEDLLRKQFECAKDAVERARIRAQLEWAIALSDGVETSLPPDQAGFFNTGCCSFSDGDITGIEIEADQIRLVRWPNDQGEPFKKELATGSLSDIFGRK
jgi:UDP-2,3-diacylglucosamine pyrophosphatase LpxH